MTCRDALPLLEDLADQELSPQQTAAVRGHLETCESCRIEFERTVQLKRLLRESAVPEPEPGYWTEVDAIIRARTVDSVPLLREEAELAEKQNQSRRLLVRSVAVFAASAVLLVSTLLITKQRSEQPDAMMSPTATLMTADLKMRVDSQTARVLNRNEQMRIAGGSMVVGAPSMVGRYSLLAGAPGSF